MAVVDINDVSVTELTKDTVNLTTDKIPLAGKKRITPAELLQSISNSTFVYEYSTTTAKADPGSGKFRLNNATLSSVTELYISETDDNSISVATLLSLLDNCIIVIKQRDSNTKHAVYQLRANADEGSYASFYLYHLSSAAMDNTSKCDISFVKNDSMVNGTSITMDEVVPLVKTIGISHDFGGTTDPIPVWCNNVLQQPMYYNPNNGVHYTTIFLPPNTQAKIDIIDDNGAWRTFSSCTLSNVRHRRNPDVIMYVSPDVDDGSGSFTELDPGSIGDAISNIASRTEVRCYQGTKPYFFGEKSISHSYDDVTFIAVEGEKPEFRGASGYVRSWTSVGSGAYSADEETGTHNGGSGSSTLSDSTASWTTNELIGMTVKNTTDGSEGVITANTATTITATLAGGTDNDWDASDAYAIRPFDSTMQQVHFYDPTYGRIERLPPLDTVAEVQGANNHGGWAIVSDVLYVSLPSNADPNNYDFIIPNGYDYCMLFYGDRIWIEGITISHYGCSSNGRGLRFSYVTTASDGLTVKNCVIRAVDAQGIIITDRNDIWIEGNIFQDYKDHLTWDDWKLATLTSEVSCSLYFQRCNRIVVFDNEVRGNADWTIFKADNETGTHDGTNNASVLTDSGSSWTTNELIGSIIRNTTDGSWGTVTANTSTTITATLIGGTDNDWDTGDAYTLKKVSNQHADVFDNFMYNYADGGELDGVNRQIRYFNNRMQSNKYLIAGATINGGPIWYVNNNAYQIGWQTPADYEATSAYSQQGTKFNYDDTPVAMMFVYNNTMNALYGNTTVFPDGARAWSNDSDTANLAHKLIAMYGANNIFAGRGHPFFDECGVSNYELWDFNQYYTTNEYSYTTNLYLWHNTGYSTFASFQSGSGVDVNSVESNPNLDANTNLPTSELPGMTIPGISNNPVFYDIKAAKGSNIAV